jgi:hypothetical protein
LHVVNTNKLHCLARKTRCSASRLVWNTTMIRTIVQVALLMALMLFGAIIGARAADKAH